MRPTQLLTDIQFDALELFEKVASTGSIAAAARNLGITPSTATRRLAHLENALGVRLFNRSTRSIGLTEGGIIALDWAKNSLKSLDEAADNLATTTGSPTGRIRVAAPHFGMNSYLAPVFAGFSKLYPNVTLDLTTNDELVSLIDDNFDVVIRYGIFAR